MPNWSHDVPADPANHGLPLRRTPARANLIGVITSDEMIGCDTHYFHARTLPCERPNCEACNEGFPFRWHSYVSYWDPKQQEHAILELTAQAAEHLVTYKQAHGTLRGCLFQASRVGARPNGRVLLRCKPADLTKLPLPSAPDLEVVLSVVWNVQQSAANAVTLQDFAPSDGSPPASANGVPPTRLFRFQDLHS